MSTVRFSFNGATTLRPWKAHDLWCMAVRLERLQWGHDLAAVEGRRRRPAPGCTRRLQWGHDLAAVEGWSSTDNRWHLSELQWGHDLAAVEGWRDSLKDAIKMSFNGATTLRPWKALLPHSFKPELSCFNGATTLRPWKAASTPCLRRPPPSFNGATTLRPWKAAAWEAVLGGGGGLQWGHDLAAVEGAWLVARAHECAQLQWGHDLAAVEGFRR